MVSMPPRTAFPTARKRHELSSGMILRTSVAPRSGMAISGGSLSTLLFFLRLKPRGFEPEGFEPVEVGGDSLRVVGASPKPSKENAPDGPAVDCSFSAGV